MKTPEVLRLQELCQNPAHGSGQCVSHACMNCLREAFALCRREALEHAAYLLGTQTVSTDEAPGVNYAMKFLQRQAKGGSQ